MNELNEFLNLIAEGKKEAEEQDIGGKFIKDLSERIRGSNPFITLDYELESIGENDETLIQEAPDVANKTETLVEEVPFPAPKTEADSVEQYLKYFKDASFQQPDVPKVDPSLKAIQDKLKFMEQWLGKISAAGPGSGEVNLRYLDDIYRPSIYDGRYLRYNDTLKKFEFAEVNPHDIVYTTNLVTSPTYTINDADYYIGINYAGPVSITLPSTPSSGRMLIIKDESGNASTNPITVSSPTDAVDNDAGGFILQIDNGGVQLLYRNGWRIV